MIQMLSTVLLHSSSVTEIIGRSSMHSISIDDQFASLSKFAISSTTDLTSQASRDAISGANILVATTTLNTSVNIPALKFAIIAGSTYSLSDLYHLLGRIGREGSSPACLPIFSVLVDIHQPLAYLVMSITRTASWVLCCGPRKT